MPIPYSIPPHRAGEEQETHLAPLNTKGKASGVGRLSCPLTLLHSSQRGIPSLLTVPGTRCQAFAWNGLGMLGMETVVIFSPQSCSGGLPLLFALPLGSCARGCWGTRGFESCSLFWLSSFGCRFEEVQKPSASFLCTPECTHVLKQAIGGASQFMGADIGQTEGRSTFKIVSNRNRACC